MSAPSPGGLLVPVSVGELVDKITILEIKEARMANPAQRRNVHTELAALRRCLQQQVPDSREMMELQRALRTVNERLWDIEDHIRECERRRSFGAAFVRLARLVYHTNDRRAALKRQVNVLCASALIEEKSYAVYQ